VPNLKLFTQSNLHSPEAIRRGTDVKDLDVVFTYDEYFKLKSSL